MSKSHAPTSQVYVRFLGEPAGAATPGAILGLPPGKASEEQIATALRRQLARIDAHPRAFTAEAEGVRQALRDAAVQLMRSGGTVELPWRGPSSTGGPTWGEKDGAPAQRERGESVDWESYRPERKLDPAVLVGGVVFIAVFLVVGLSVVLGTKTSPPTTPPPPPTGAAPVAPAAATTNAAAPAPEGPLFTPSVAPLAPTDPTLALRQLRGAAGRIKGGDASGVGEFATALAWLGDNWVRLDLGQRRAADDAIVEYLYAAGSRSAAWDGVLAALSSAVEPLTGEGTITPERVWPAAFAAGVLQRLSREREFPAQYANDLARLHIAALGEDRPRQSATFEAGAGAALRRLIPRILTRDPAAAKAAPMDVDLKRDAQRLVDALARLTEAIAACGFDGAAQEQLIADALEGLMLRGDPEMDEGVFAGVQQLALAMKWRREGAARARLLAWFDDARLTSSDLNVLTTALATKSGAEGVDATMTLSAGASPMDRQSLRQRYSQAWGVGAASAGVDASEWLQFARQRLDYPGPSGTLPDDLAAAAVLARVNQSARLLWAGDRSAAAASLDHAEKVESSITRSSSAKVAQAAPGLPRRGGASAGPDGEWAQSYLAQGRHIANRMAKLAEFDHRAEPIAVDAAVLADEACFGSPPDVRLKAQSVVIRFGRSPVMVNAVLDALPRTAPSETVSRMIQTLTGATMPKPNHPDWPLHARRALVATLVDALAADSAQTTMDAAAKLVSDAYMDVLGPVDPAMPPAPRYGAGDDGRSGGARAGGAVGGDDRPGTGAVAQPRRARDARDDRGAKAGPPVARGRTGAALGRGAGGGVRPARVRDGGGAPCDEGAGAVDHGGTRDAPARVGHRRASGPLDRAGDDDAVGDPAERRRGAVVMLALVMTLCLLLGGRAGRAEAGAERAGVASGGEPGARKR